MIHVTQEIGKYNIMLTEGLIIKKRIKKHSQVRLSKKEHSQVCHGNQKSTLMKLNLKINL